MASLDKEIKNFVRINILVLDNIKNALVNMFKYYLQKVRKEEISFEKFIGEHVADIKYLKRSGILHQKEVDMLIVGDKAIPGLKEDDLDVTIVRCLLDNLCPDLFMDKGCNTLQDFLKTNQHDIYHLFIFKECCQCSHDYTFPVTEELLKKNEYKKMFKLLPCTKCAAKSGTVCSVLPCIDTEYIKFDYNIKKIVFGHFSPIYKAMQKLTNIRNEAVGHAVAARIPNALYDGYIKDIEENIIVLARICENEDEARLALDEVQNILCDDTLCNQYQNRLIEQAKRDQELREGIEEINQRLQKLTEEVSNLKAPARNLTKGNDQRGQVNQSSIDTDAEPYINNDLENKTDGVVLHVEDDRVAAKEFIKNMKREHPDLNIDIISYDELLPGASQLRSAANIFLRYIYLFIFETQNLKKKSFEMYIAEIALVETLKTFGKQGRIIPVAVERDITFDNPILAPLLPLKYHNYLEAKISHKGPDQDFSKCFRDLIIKGRQKHRVG